MTLNRQVSDICFSEFPIDQYSDDKGLPTRDEVFTILKDALTLPFNLKVWNISSSSRCRELSEDIRAVMPFMNSIGVACRWLRIHGDEDFFKIGKRLNDGFYSSSGKGAGNLCEFERRHYEEIMEENIDSILSKMNATDFNICILNDPLTAGLIPLLKAKGIKCIWRLSSTSENKIEHYSMRSWNFIKRYVQKADSVISSYSSMHSAFLNEIGAKLSIITPSIDTLSAKNRVMDSKTIDGILYHMGILDAEGIEGRPECSPTFFRSDGKKDRVRRHADVFSTGKLPNSKDRMILHLSRWNSLKDKVGIMRSFADYVIQHFSDVYLLLAGPAVMSVEDDPEQLDSYSYCVKEWARLPEQIQSKVIITCLPVKDMQENWAMVNALQRKASVIVHKSLQDGFGLGILEALWKGKPVVATAVGGIPKQIKHRQNGLLIEDPTDLKGFGEAIVEFLKNHDLEMRLGNDAHVGISQKFLPHHSVRKYLELFQDLYKKT